MRCPVCKAETCTSCAFKAPKNSELAAYGKFVCYECIKTVNANVERPACNLKHGLYEKHEDVGKHIQVTEDVVFGNGNIIKKGTKGRLLRVEPGAESLCYIAKMEGLDKKDISNGERGFDKHQFTFVS